MKMSAAICRLLFFVFAAPTDVAAGLLGPSNYDECIQSSMKGVTSDIAARAIIQSCRRQFSEPKEVTIALPSDAVRLLTGRAAFRDSMPELRETLGKKGAKPYYDEFSGELFNGTSDWTIRSIDVLLEWSDSGKKEQRTFRAVADVSPLTERPFEIKANFGSSENVKQTNWSISGAHGVKVK